jgi:hypothetical protein
VFCKLGFPLFGVLLDFWTKKALKIIMTCAILHDMIIEDEKGLNLEFFYENFGSRVQPQRTPDSHSSISGDPSAN